MELKTFSRELGSVEQTGNPRRAAESRTRWSSQHSAGLSSVYSPEPTTTESPKENTLRVLLDDEINTLPNENALIRRELQLCRAPANNVTETVLQGPVICSSASATLQRPLAAAQPLPVKTLDSPNLDNRN